jgi:hypothetical protein
LPGRALSFVTEDVGSDRSLGANDRGVRRAGDRIVRRGRDVEKLTFAVHKRFRCPTMNNPLSRLSHIVDISAYRHRRAKTPTVLNSL